MTASRWISVVLGVMVVLLWWHGLPLHTRSDVKWWLYRKWRFEIVLAISRCRVRRDPRRLYMAPRPYDQEAWEYEEQHADDIYPTSEED